MSAVPKVVVAVDLARFSDASRVLAGQLGPDGRQTDDVSGLSPRARTSTSIQAPR